MCFMFQALLVNLINTTRLGRNDIHFYFPAGQPAELSFNGIIFTYADNVRNQFILRQSKKQSVFRITKPTIDQKIWYNCLVYLSYQNLVANTRKVIIMEAV